MSTNREIAAGWACPTCARTTVPFAPSGRCRSCEFEGQASDQSADGSEEGYLQIGEVAERVGLSLRTVRFYEEAGLVLPAGRTPGGFRLYRDAAIERLLVIKQMKPLGFTLEEMRSLLEARAELESGALTDEGRRKIGGRLALFAAMAREKCEDLRRQLEVAESFSATLSGDVTRVGGEPTQTDP